MSIAYIDTLVIEFDNCFGKILQGKKGGYHTCPRYTKIKAKRAAKIERYVCEAEDDIVIDKIFLGSAEESNQGVYESMVLQVSLLRMYT